MDLSDILKCLEHLKSQNYISGLHEALREGSIERVKLRFNNIIAEINKLTNSDHKKVEKREEIVKTIFKNKISCSIIEEIYPILIIYAVNTTKDYIFKLILPEELNSKGCSAQTALHYAVQSESVDNVRLLLEAGADVNSVNKHGATPLHFAACLQNEEICQILLNFEAEIEPEHGFCSPLAIVCGCTYSMGTGCLKHRVLFNPKIAKLLIDRGANVDETFLGVCYNGNLESVKFLLQFGANLSFQDEEGNSALHHASAGNSLKVVDFLLAKGLDINIKNAKNQTPLFYTMKTHWIDYETNLDMFEYLVDHGTDINARDNFNTTILHRISADADTLQHILKTVIECLLELGADYKLEIGPNMFFNCYCPGTNILISYIALYENKLGIHINYYFGYTESLFQAREYFEKSRLEVEKLKSRRIVRGTTVSFYDFLSGGFYNAVQIVKNEEIKKIFVSREYYREFPCYSFLLEKRFERVISLMDAVDKMENFLTNCLSILPTLINRKILNLFRSSDFRKFEHNILCCQNAVEQEEDSNLEFKKWYPAEIVEIREIGVMVSLYPGMTPALLPYSKIENFSIEDIGRIGEFKVSYLGRHPASGRIILSYPVREV